MTRDPRIDTYIARKADFARPILEYFRAAVHAACPAAEETLKWSAPAFVYKGSILAGMAAFNAHAAINFWRGKEVTGEAADKTEAMGQFGKLTSVEDLPSENELAAMIRKAMALIDAGPASRKPKHSPKPPAEVPADLVEALAANPAALATFESFPPSARREYSDWVADAKRPETRTKRIADAVTWLAEGKRRNWKYENC